MMQNVTKQVGTQRHTPVFIGAENVSTIFLAIICNNQTYYLSIIIIYAINPL